MAPGCGLGADVSRGTHARGTIRGEPRTVGAGEERRGAEQPRGRTIAAQDDHGAATRRGRTLSGKTRSRRWQAAGTAAGQSDIGRDAPREKHCAAGDGGQCGGGRSGSECGACVPLFGRRAASRKDLAYTYHVWETCTIKSCSSGRKKSTKISAAVPREPITTLLGETLEGTPVAEEGTTLIGEGAS